MSKVLVTESSLSGIAAAIRAKNGSSDTYKPGQMAAAIQEIPTGTTPTGTVNITQNGTVDVTDYASADVAVPNSYAAGDEGKVVSNGALVAQTARATDITSNGTYDTTLNDEVTVNVSGGGGSNSFLDMDFSKFPSGATLMTNVSVSDGKAVFSQTGGRISLPIVYGAVTIEIDVKDMNLTRNQHRRFIMATNEQGFIYRDNGKWSFYANNAWASDSSISDGSYFANSTLKVIIDSNGYWHIYKDNVLVYEPDRNLTLNSNTGILIGSNSASINAVSITGIHIY